MSSEYRWAARVQSGPVFAFGAKLFDGGRSAHVWGFGTPDAGPALKAVTRFIKKHMVPQLLSDGVHRAQAISHPANEIAHHWLTHLGFSLKARISGVGSRKEDMLLFETNADVQRRARSSIPLFPA
jgi:hypothetical protein